MSRQTAIATISSALRSDEELVTLFIDGDLSSFEELVSRYSSKAFGLASRLTRNQQDAEEVLQDVFVTVYRKLASFKGDSTFSSWLYRITMNCALMKIRRKKKTQILSLDEILPSVDNEPAFRTQAEDECDNIAVRNQLIAAIEDAVRRLPDEYRPVFVLRDVDGLTSREVSQMLKLSVPAVKSRLHRSRSILRRRLRRVYRDLHAQESEVGG